MEGNGNGNRGGKREGAGRKPKVDEETLIEKLRPMDEKALAMINEGLEKKDAAILKIFMSYRYGQPRQTIDTNIMGDLSINWLEVKTYDTK